jgi:hypothetical protein
MSLKGKLANKAAAVSVSAAEAAALKIEGAAVRCRGLRAVFSEDDRGMTPENLLAGIVAAVRADERDEERTSRDVFTTARSRRRRLGLLSFGAGPMVGVASQVVDLYCETATVCDVAALHSVDLTEHQIAAHMLVLWGIVDSFDEADVVMKGAGSRTLTSIVGSRVRSGVGDYLPADLTKRAAVQALWDARSLVGDVRGAAGEGTVRGVVFTGHRTKQLIKAAERQLGVDALHAGRCETVRTA